LPARLLVDFHASAGSAHILTITVVPTPTAMLRRPPATSRKVVASEKVLMEDEVFFERALAEYRESTGDLQEFAELPIGVQSEILHRAHQMKADLEREKRVEPV
jgi:hypothetical protein